MAQPRNYMVTAFFLSLLLFVLYQTILLFLPFFQAIFWGAILAFAFYPVYRFMRESWELSETFAAAFLTVFIVVTIVPPVIMLFLQLATQAVDWYQAVADYAQSGGFQELLVQLRSNSGIRKIDTWLADTGIAAIGVETWAVSWAQTVGNYFAVQAGSLTKDLLTVAMHAVITFWLLFVFLRYGERIYRFFFQITPLNEAHKRALFGRVNETLSAVIRGQLLTAFAQALCAGLIFWILGAPFPLLFGVLTFVMALIPLVGASAVWLPLVGYFFIHGMRVRALILLFLGVFGISLLDNILRPLLIRGRTKLPYVLLFLGILGGVSVHGLVGVFVGPVVLSLFFAIIKIYREEYLKA